MKVKILHRTRGPMLPRSMTPLMLLVVVEEQEQAQVAKSHNWKGLAMPLMAKPGNLELQRWLIFLMTPQQTH